jgi:hypothetical protein
MSTTQIPTTLYKLNNSFAQKRRGQKKPGEAKRSLKSFLKESYFESIRYHRILPLQKVE